MSELQILSKAEMKGINVQMNMEGKSKAIPLQA